VIAQEFAVKACRECRFSNGGHMFAVPTLLTSAYVSLSPFLLAPREHTSAYVSALLAQKYNY